MSNHTWISARRALTAAALLICSLGVPLAAQAPAAPPSPAPTGTLSGRVIDARTGEPLSEVGVQLVGLGRGVQTGVDGRFRFSGVAAGTLTIQARRIGYQPKVITGLYLEAGKVTEQNIVLDQAAVSLTAMVATAESERGSVSAVLDEQRNASAIVSSIGAEQIRRSPDSDAAQALQRVSGVTVQDGKYLNVRGLDPRYTTASLNGARLPSPEPERKVVPFDIFPASLLQAVTTSKTFTPDQPGDFSGGAVNLRTRESPPENERSYSVSVGANDAVLGRAVLSAPRTGAEWLGFGGGARRLPGTVAGADFNNSYSQQDYNQFVSAFRNAWSAREVTGRPSSSMSVTLGGNSPVAGREIGYVGAFSYGYGHEIRTDEVRAFAVPTPAGGTEPVDRYVGTTGRESALWGGVLNLNSLLGTHSRLSLNNTFTRSADNEARFEEGFDENSGFPMQLTRLRYVQRAVLSSQLAGEHELRDGQRLQWGVTGSRVTRTEPDRSESAYAIDETTGGAPYLFAGNESAVRTFGRLGEYNVNGTADFSLRFGASSEHLVKAGVLGRYTDRRSDVESYSIRATLARPDRELQPEEIFDGRFAGPADSVFAIDAVAQAGSYDASDVVGAGYAMTEYQLGGRVRLVGGARFESQRLEIVARPAFDRPVTVTPVYNDVLPSLAMNVAVSDRQMVRLSASQTLARPEYREVVPINSRDVLGGEQFRGNVNLKRTLIRNADLRWELYPSPGEVISLAAFVKQFDNPIERVYRGTSGTRVTTFENARSALNLGGELELRKGLGFLAEALSPWTMFSNLTVMHSEIDIAAAGAGSVEPARAMVGQAPYVVNAGVTYANRSGRLSATALYNMIGRRIYAASLLPLPNVHEEPRQMVDLSLRFPLARGLSGKIDAKNLLDAPYEVTQGSVQREFYRVGRSVTFGLSW